GLELWIVFWHGLNDALHPLGINWRVQSCDFHSAAEAEVLSHRSNGHTGFGENSAGSGQLARLAQGQAVALACLHWERQTQMPSHWVGPCPAAKHKFIGHVITGATAHGLESIALHLPAIHLRAPLKLHPFLFQ